MLTLLITNDETIKEMNKQYRQLNKPTDVLSFPLLEKPLVNAPADLSSGRHRRVQMRHRPQRHSSRRPN